MEFSSLSESKTRPSSGPSQVRPKEYSKSSTEYGVHVPCHAGQSFQAPPPTVATCSDPPDPNGGPEVRRRGEVERRSTGGGNPFLCVSLHMCSFSVAGLLYKAV